MGRPFWLIHVNVYNVSASGGQKPRLWANFDFWGTLVPMRVKFGVLEQTQVLHLHAKCHLNVFIVSVSGGQKTQCWANFDFCGAPVLTPFYRWRPIWCAIADPRCTLTRQISSQLLYSAGLCWRKTPIFAVFGLWHLVVSPIGSSLKKMNTGAQLKTFPYPKWYQNRFCTVVQRLRGEIGRGKHSKAWPADKQTDKQTNKKTQRFSPPQQRVKSEI